MVHLTGTYTDVDRSPDPVGAAEWMDTMCDWPFIRAYKERTVDLLQVKPRRPPPRRRVWDRP